MKPFVQKQNQPGSRWVLFIGVVAAGFGIWFFDLLPEFRPVPSGELAAESQNEVPIPDLWDDQIIDRSGDSAPSPADGPDALLDAIADDADPLDRVLHGLSEPEISVEQRLDVTPPDDTGTPAQIVRPASFANPPRPNEPQSQVRHNHEIVPVSGSAAQNSVLPPETADALRNADLLIRQDRIVDAHNVLSTLYWKHPERRALFQRRIESTAAEIFANPHRHIGDPYLVEPGDTLEAIGVANNIPWQYLAQLNRIKPNELQAGHKLKIIPGPFSAVIDLSRFELTIDAHGYFVRRYKIGIGENNKTPTGEFTVQEKIENPTWYDPNGGQIDKDDPTNPLGEFWIGLGDHIGIHGTIDPQSIGAAQSRGCIHMRDDDIAEVFAFLGSGSTVRIRP